MHHSRWCARITVRRGGVGGTAVEEKRTGGRALGFLDRIKGAAESAQAATSKFGVGASAAQMGLANRAQKLTKVGVDTPAHIDSMTATGNTDKPGGTEYDITFTITPAGGEPYHVTTNQYIYP